MFTNPLADQGLRPGTGAGVMLLVTEDEAAAASDLKSVEEVSPNLAVASGETCDSVAVVTSRIPLSPTTPSASAMEVAVNPAVTRSNC
jgi:hypothetical protein